MVTTEKELDKIALEYHSSDILKDKFIEDWSQEYSYQWVFSKIRGSHSVLEMGYGEGNFTDQLVKRGFDITVVDGSALLLEKAKALYEDRIKTDHFLFEKYSPGRKFDCILATHVLEHVDHPVELLKRMKTWLTDTGLIVLIVPNMESIHRQLAVVMGLQPALDSLGERDRLVGHKRVYSMKALVSDVEASGLKAVETTGFFLKILPNSMMLNFSEALLKALLTISPSIPANLLANIAVIARA